VRCIFRPAGLPRRALHFSTGVHMRSLPSAPPSVLAVTPPGESRPDTPARPGGAVYDPKVAKLVLEEMCLDAGVKFQLHAMVAGAVTEIA
jgi:hypothetical protein